MRNFPKTEEDFKLTTQEEFMETLRATVADIHKYLENSYDGTTTDSRLVLVLPPDLVPSLKGLLPAENMIYVGGLFLGFRVDTETIMVYSNHDATEMTFYALGAPKEVIPYKHYPYKEVPPDKDNTTDVEFVVQ